MQIIRDIQSYIAHSDASLSTALQKINNNKHRIVFAVSEKGILEGVMTDGDFRRYLLSGEKIDLNVPLSIVANKGYVSYPIDAEPENMEALFSDKVEFIPMVDSSQHLVAIASRERSGFSIGEFLIGQGRVFIIAEIGINHNGSLELGKKLIEAAARAGADCVKFQMRDLDSLYRNREEKGQFAKEDLGAQYIIDLLSRFQLTKEQMFELFDYSKSCGVLPMCTPWDICSLKALEDYGMLAYKIASADLTNHELVLSVAKTGKPLICSTGMSTETEIQQVIQLLERQGANYALLHCNSTYPAPFKDIHLKYMSRLSELSHCPIGYSGHEREYHVAIAAVAIGATIIEKHFTLDRSLEGNDHKVSLLPDEFAKMVEGIRQTEEALGVDQRRVPSQGELMNRENLAKSIVAKEAIPVGTIITRAMVDFKSPGRGLQPNRIDELLGQCSKRDMDEGDFFFEGDVRQKIEARDFHVKRPWGLPVRYHDFSELGSQSNPDFLEFHLSYKDLDLDESEFINTKSEQGLVVHSPDLFQGDHLLNFASKDPFHRKRSIQELQRVIDTALRLKEHFTTSAPIPVVVSLGGFSTDRHLEKCERNELYDLVFEGLQLLNTEGVEILPQTLPPFPWYFGGQLYCNLFVELEDTIAFCEKYGYRVCFDISHSKLSCNYYRQSFSDFTQKIAPHVGHLHIVDAKGHDGEGIQIGEGDVDWKQICNILNATIPKVPFIPEIWQGHKNNGEGFWTAMDRLEGLL